MSEAGDQSVSPNSSDESFVRKVRSHVSGLLPSSISKWFAAAESPRSTAEVRPRDEEDEESFRLQPPIKRLKLPDPPSTPSNHSFLIPDVKQHLSQQPSTSSHNFVIPEPRQFKQTLNHHARKCDSDSEESTSGYSSKDVDSSEKCISPKNGLFSSHELSLFDKTSTINRSQSGASSSLSNRRPMFNASAFGSPNFMDRTLSTKRIVNSPFYSGRTMYGGASAMQSFGDSTSPKQPQRRPLFAQVKDSTGKQGGAGNSLSRTAQKILDTLESYTSQGDHVKKIPNPPKRFAGLTPYGRVASNTQLQVPHTTSLLNMKVQLQDSTSRVREIVKEKPSPRTSGYKLREETSNGGSNSMKMKSKISSTRPKIQLDDIPTESVKLPDVQLPISTMPTFNFSIPPIKVNTPPKTTTTIVQPEVKPKEQEKPKEQPKKQEKPAVEVVSKQSQEKPSEFKFSKPIILMEFSAKLKELKAINDFKFSEPLNGNRTDDSKIKEKVGEYLESLADKFKPAADTWECQVCLIRNSASKKRCAACETPKAAAPVITAAPTPKTMIDSFGDKFKKSANEWECSACMIRNKSNVSKCVACETPKESTTPKPAAPAVGDGKKDWTCDVCMVPNKPEQAKCVCCEAPRPGGTKPAAAKWTCDVCMVPNDADKLKCVCCEASKPGAAPVATQPASKAPMISKFNFGVDKAQLNGLGITFGMPPVAKTDETDSKKVEESNKPAFTFGASTTSGLAPTDNKPTFTFGSAKKDDNAESSSAAKPTFNFGVPPAVATTSAAISDNTTKPTFTFGAPAKVEPKTAVTTETSAPIQPTFSFGAPKPSTTTTTSGSEPTKPLFSFGAPKPESEKPAVNGVTNGLFSFGGATAAAPKPTFSFGAAPTSNGDTTKLFNGSTTAAPTTTAAPALPNFGATFSSPASTAAAPQTNGFNFGAAAAPKIADNSTAKPAFNFGAAPAATPGLFSFGSNQINAPSAPAPAPTLTVPTGGFNFGAAAANFNPEIKPSFNFTAGTAAPPVFGATSTDAGGPLKQRVFKRAVRRTTQR